MRKTFNRWCRQHPIGAALLCGAIVGAMDYLFHLRNAVGTAFRALDFIFIGFVIFVVLMERRRQRSSKDRVQPVIDAKMAEVAARNTISVEQSGDQTLDMSVIQHRPKQL